MMYAVYTHGLLRTQHLIALFAGGKAIATLPPQTTARLLNGPIDVAGDRYWQVACDTTITGWISERDLVAEPSDTNHVETARPTILRPRPGGSPQQIKKRARALFDHGVFCRIDEPLRSRRDRIVGSTSKIVGIGDAGADLLEEVYGIERGSIRWDAKNADLKDRHKRHTLAITDVMILVISACQARSDVRYLARDDILAQSPDTTKNSSRPLRWNFTHERKGKKREFSSTPDSLFGLEMVQSEGQSLSRYFLLEADLKNEPLNRIQLKKQSSLKRKFLTYGLGYTKPHQFHRERFHLPSFRVLTVTTSPKRARNMLDLVATLKADWDIPDFLFYFTDFEALREYEDVLNAPWLCWRDGKVAETTL